MPHSYDKCPVCHRWGWPETHHCPPSWEVWPDYYDESEASTVYANDAEEAATTFLKERFSDFDYPNSMTVIVRKDDDEWTFEIEVEAVPSFHASEIKHETMTEAEEEPETEGGDLPNL